VLARPGIEIDPGKAASADASVHHSRVTPPLRRPSPDTTGTPSGVPTIRVSDAVRGAVPHLVPDHHVELSDVERTILSKVDGRRAVRDVALMVSFSLVEVVAMFLDLAGRGVVRLEGVQPPDRRGASGVRPMPSRADETTITIDEDDFDEIEFDDPAHLVPTVAGQMRAITPEQAQRVAQPRPTLPTIPRPDNKR
jgi:hypothetical protein